MADDKKPKQDAKTGQFVTGTSSRGRMKGSRNRLHGAFVSALEDDFREFGPATIVIVRKERPAEYLKLVAVVLPKEFILEDGRVESMGDEELEQYLAEVTEAARRLQLSGPGQAEQDPSDPAGGKKPALN